MKKAIIAIVPFLLVGCADTERYYDAVNQRNIILLEYVKRQAQDNENTRLRVMNAFSDAAVKASKTTDRTDDILVAFAWGAASEKRYDITMPNLQEVEAPKDGVDYLKAALPYVTMLYPFLASWGYGGGDRGDTSYVATDNAQLMIGSQNPGSHNVAGNDQSILGYTDNRRPYQDDEDELTTLPVMAPEVPGDCPGAFYRDGIWWYTNTCSCNSHNSGKC